MAKRKPDDSLNSGSDDDPSYSPRGQGRRSRGGRAGNIRQRTQKELISRRNEHDLKKKEVKAKKGAEELVKKIETEDKELEPKKKEDEPKKGAEESVNEKGIEDKEPEKAEESVEIVSCKTCGIEKEYGEEMTKHIEENHRSNKEKEEEVAEKEEHKNETNEEGGNETNEEGESANKEKEEEVAEKEELKNETNEEGGNETNEEGESAIKDKPKPEDGEDSKMDTEEKSDEEQIEEVETTPCDECKEKENNPEELKKHVEKEHEIKIKELPDKKKRDLKGIPVLRDFHTRGCWFTDNQDFPAGISLRSNQREFIQIIPNLKKMFKKKEGNQIGKTKIKAVSVETKGKKEYTAVLIASKMVKKTVRTGKAVLKIYEKEKETSVTVTTLTGSPVQTAEEVGDLLEEVIKKMIEGTETQKIIEEIDEEEKIKERVDKIRLAESKEKKTCKHCKKILKTEAGLRIHVEKEHKISCDVCKLRLKSEEALEEHKDRLHRVREKCTICRKGFSDREDLRKHLRTKHKQNIVTDCNICKKSFYNKAGCEEHMERCNEAEKEKQLLKEEVEKAKEDKIVQDKKEEEEKELKRKEVEKTEEDKVEKEKKDEEIKKTKEAEEEAKKKVTCNNCKQEVANNNEAMKEHLEQHELQLILFTCNECENTSKTEAEMRTHMKIHEEKKCKECNFKTENESEMTEHVKKLHEIKQCPECNFSSTRDEELSAHMLMGHKVKCKACPMIVNNEKEMIDHIKSKHTEVKCDDCNFRSTDEAELKAHMIMGHKMKCKECGEVLKNNDELMSHKEKMHKKRLSKPKEIYKGRKKTKEIPDKLKEILGDNKELLDISGGNGNCQVQCIAVKAFGDKMYGPVLKRRINKYIAANLDDFGAFGYSATEEDPFLREMGSGDNFGWQMASSNQELKHLLEEGNSLTLWGDQGELKAAADILKTDIIVNKINSAGSEEPVTINKMPAKEKKENAETIELVLNEDEGHYYVVIDKEDYLARGTIKERLENCEEVVEDQRKDGGEEMKERFQNQINKANDKIRDTMEENIKLKAEIKLVKSITNLNKIEKEQREQFKENDLRDKKKMSYSEVTKQKPIEDEAEEDSNDEEYNCNQCQYQGEDENKLMKHMKKKHNTQKNHDCDECNYSCTGTLQLRKHEDECHTVQCNKCDFKTMKEEKMRSHMKDSHNQDLQGGKTVEEEQSGSESESEDSNEESNDEEEADDESFEFPCGWKKCSEGFVNRNELREHRAEKHKNPRPCRWFLEDQCEFTEKTCTFTHKQRENEKNHEEISCNICDHKVKNMNDLHSHRKLKHEANIRSCEAPTEDDCPRGERCWYSHKSEEEREFEIKECRYGNKCSSIRNGKDCWWLHKNPKPKPYESKIFNKRSPFQKKKPQNQTK